MGTCIKSYVDKVSEAVKDKQPGVTNLGKQVLRIIKKHNAEAVKDIEADMLKYLSENKVRVLGEPSGNIQDVSVNDDGNVTVTTDKSVHEDVNIRSGMTTNYERLLVPMANTVTPSGFGDVTKAISRKSALANGYVSHMLIGSVEAGGGFLSPHVEKWHKAAQERFGLYKEAVNLVKGGFGNPDLWKKIQATTFLTGDIDRSMLAEITAIADTSSRRTYELLDTELPKLDKKIKKLIRNKADREQLDVIFGTSGYGNVVYMPEVAQAIYDGKSLEEVKAIVGASKKELKEAKVLKEYMVNRKVNGNIQNADGSKRVAVMATLLALEEKDARGRSGYDTLMWLREKHGGLFVQLEKLSATVHTLNEVVNRGYKDSSFGKGAGNVYKGYDGHNTLDVMETTLEYKVIKYKDKNKYLKEGSPWKEIREAKNIEGEFGIIARESTSSFMAGIGVNTNRIRNGIGISKDEVKKLDSGEIDRVWMDDNNIVSDYDNGYERFRVMLTGDEYDAAGGMKNIAHRLMRTYTHNKELIETESVRELIVDKMTYKGADGILGSVNKVIKANKRLDRDKREAVKPFIDTELNWEKDVKEKYPEIYEMYTPVEHISNYGGFNEKIRYVRKDMKDMVTGHTQNLIASDDWPNFQKWERYYKQIVQMMKIKMVVANPAKLAADVASNMGILMTMDVSVADAFRYSKETLKYSSEMSKLEGDLVKAQFDLGLAEAGASDVGKAKAKVDKARADMEAHPYYEALEAGFIQSMGTSMMIKEFDTISGLQHTIDSLAKKLLEDGKGEKTAIHNALSVWMDYGFGANDILDAVGNISKLEGTKFSEELLAISDRLKSKKARIKWNEEKAGRPLTDAEKKELHDNTDTVGYISEFIAAPSSEVVRYGSWAMQSGDAMARWSLYNHRVNQGLVEKGIELPFDSTKHIRKTVKRAIADGKMTEAEWLAIRDTAAIEALDTFIDYRLNVPSEVKGLSDYGVFLFPSFWMRTQKVIWNLAKYHPLNAGGGLLIADLLGNSSANIMTANVINKAWNGSLVYPGGQTHNLLDPDTYLLF